jgi:hypothetical protein
VLPAVLTAALLVPVPVAAFNFLGNWQQVVTSAVPSGNNPPLQAPIVKTNDSDPNGPVVSVDMNNFQVFNQSAVPGSPWFQQIVLTRTLQINSSQESVQVDRSGSMGFYNAGVSVKVDITPTGGSPLSTTYSGTLHTFGPVYNPNSGSTTPITNTGTFTFANTFGTVFMQQHDDAVYQLANQGPGTFTVTITITAMINPYAAGSITGAWSTQSPWQFQFSPASQPSLAPLGLPGSLIAQSNDTPALAGALSSSGFFFP